MSIILQLFDTIFDSVKENRFMYQDAAFTTLRTKFHRNEEYLIRYMYTRT